MASASRRRRILEALKSRLTAIHGSTFETDAGYRVFLGYVPMLGPDDPDSAIAILPGDDQIEHRGARFGIVLPVEVFAIAKASLEEPWKVVEGVIADIKRAIELSDRTLGGLLPHDHALGRGSTRTLEREPGSPFVGAAITYEIAYTEAYGQPEEA